MSLSAMPESEAISIEAVLDRTEALISAEADDLARDAPALAGELLAMGEAVLIAWNRSRGAEPTEARVEGFRLLALHRQGARGEPSFNACRETCRELVWHHNLILHDPAAPETARNVRLGAMVLRHLALFIAGKLEDAGLGDFCCSSRPARLAEPAAPSP